MWPISVLIKALEFKASCIQGVNSEAMYPILVQSDRGRVYQALYFVSAAMFTVCIHGLGTTINISSSLCKHPQLWANLYRHSTFE